VRPDQARSLETALGNRTDWLRGQLNLEREHIRLRQAEDNLLWALSLDADVSRGTGGGRATAHRGALRLSVPIAERSREASLLNARNGVRQAEMNIAELRQSVGIAVRQAVRAVEVGFRRIELARQSRTLAEERLEIEQAKLEQGLTSTLRLTLVEEDLVRAQEGELNATVAYLDALTALDRTLGTTLEAWGIEIERLER